MHHFPAFDPAGRRGLASSLSFTPDAPPRRTPTPLVRRCGASGRAALHGSDEIVVESVGAVDFGSAGGAGGIAVQEADSPIGTDVQHHQVVAGVRLGSSNDCLLPSEASLKPRSCGIGGGAKNDSTEVDPVA